MSSGIGQVETRFFTFGDADHPLTLRSGVELYPVTLAYETYGKLNAAKDNAILVFHALSGSQHAAGYNPAVPEAGSLWNEDCHTGWWDEFIGPGRALDTDRFYVICANYLGGCYGSTGPSSINPATKKPYGSSFPQLTFADMVDAQIRLIDHLGIDQLRGVIGGSVGGMLCLSLATRHPERVRMVIPIATGLTPTILQRIHNFEQIYAIEQDPNFNEGDYYDGPRPETGLALARMIAHKTYVSLSTMENRARDEVVPPNEGLRQYRFTHPVESYLLHQGRKFMKRFDANTYLHICFAWLQFDLQEECGADSHREMFSRCTHQRYMQFSIDSDVCFYPDEQQELGDKLRHAKVPHRRITIHSDKGHDAFLLEPELLAPHLAHTLEIGW